MTDTFGFLIFTFAASLMFEALNGRTDAPNEIATVVAEGLTLGQLAGQGTGGGTSPGDTCSMPFTISDLELQHDRITVSVLPLAD